MGKVMAVFGTRPEAIKMCPVIDELKKRPGLETLVCVTGQHEDMLRGVLDCFSVRPDYNLHIMREGQTLHDITRAVLGGMQGILSAEKPDLALVHGDTTTTFAGALSAFYMGIPVGHVEAGLRTGRLDAPFPEEFNRKAAAIVAALNFAPTETARQNLLKEGYSPDTIYVTGNTAIDALRVTVKPEYSSEVINWARGSRMLLVTAHRRECLGAPLRAMLRAIRRVADADKSVKVVYPVHMNPQVRRAAREELYGHDRIRLIEPLDVIDFHNLMAAAYIILTDSGGIQEEAPSLGKPVLVMRDATERPEGVEAGTLRLAGTSEEGVYRETMALLSDEDEYRAMSDAKNPYGDGFASRRIADVIENLYGGR